MNIGERPGARKPDRAGGHVERRTICRSQGFSRSISAFGRPADDSTETEGPYPYADLKLEEMEKKPSAKSLKPRIQ
jgi:hypothetical protein